MPPIPYAAKMAEKSNTMVLAVSDDNPATTNGITNVLLNMSECLSNSYGAIDTEIREIEVVFNTMP